MLPKVQLERHLRNYLEEDIPSFDIGGYVVGNEVKTAHLLCKGNCVLSGVVAVDYLFTRLLHCSVQWLYKDGDKIQASSDNRVVVAIVEGPVSKVLQGERVALNLMARTSGITTLAADVSQQLTGWTGRIAGTRKTTPGFRMFEKYALLVAGVDMHRMDLSSMVMLKDNHVWSYGSIGKAVKAAKSAAGFSVKVEVECRSLEEAQEAVEAGADVVMLDNFEPSLAQSTAKTLKSSCKHVIIEVSGGITKDSISDFACNDIDIISMGSLTQGVPHVDFSLKVQKGRVQQ